jgi:hypothetical protein
MRPLNAARAAPATDADNGPRETAKLAGLQLPNIANPPVGQGDLATRFNAALARALIAFARPAELGGPPS